MGSGTQAKKSSQILTYPIPQMKKDPPEKTKKMQKNYRMTWKEWRKGKTRWMKKEKMKLKNRSQLKRKS